MRSIKTTPLQLECKVNGTECFDSWVWVPFFYLFYFYLFLFYFIDPEQCILNHTWYTSWKSAMNIDPVHAYTYCCLCHDVFMCCLRCGHYSDGLCLSVGPFPFSVTKLGEDWLKSVHCRVLCLWKWSPIWWSLSRTYSWGSHIDFIDQLSHIFVLLIDDLLQVGRSLKSTILSTIAGRWRLGEFQGILCSIQKKVNPS